MVFTKIALALGVLLLGFFVWIALVGMNAVGEGLVTLVALVVLIGGGNMLSGRGGRRRHAGTEPRPISAPTPAPPPGTGGSPSGGAAGERG